MAGNEELKQSDTVGIEENDNVKLTQQEEVQAQQNGILQDKDPQNQTQQGVIQDPSQKIQENKQPPDVVPIRETFKLSDIFSSKKNEFSKGDEPMQAEQNQNSQGPKNNLDEQNNSGNKNLLNSIKDIFSQSKSKDTLSQLQNNNQSSSKEDRSPSQLVNGDSKQEQIVTNTFINKEQVQQKDSQISEQQISDHNQNNNDNQKSQILTSVVQTQQSALESTQKGLQGLNNTIEQISAQVKESLTPNSNSAQDDVLKQKLNNTQQMQQNFKINSRSQNSIEDVSSSSPLNSKQKQSSIETIRPAIQNLQVPEYKQDSSTLPQAKLPIDDVQESSLANAHPPSLKELPSRPMTSPTSVNLTEPLMQRLRPQSPLRILPSQTFITPKGRSMKGQQVLDSIDRLSQRQSSYVKNESIMDLQKMLDLLNIKDTKDIGNPKPPLKLSREELESTVLRLYTTNREKYQAPPRIRSARLIFVKDTNGYKEQYKNIPYKKYEDRTALLKQLYARCQEQNVKKMEELKATYLKPLTSCKKYVGTDNQDLKRVVQRLYEGQGST